MLLLFHLFLVCVRSQASVSVVSMWMVIKISNMSLFYLIRLNSCLGQGVQIFYLPLVRLLCKCINPLVKPLLIQRPTAVFQGFDGLEQWPFSFPPSFSVCWFFSDYTTKSELRAPVNGRKDSHYLSQNSPASWSGGKFALSGHFSWNDGLFLWGHKIITNVGCFAFLSVCLCTVCMPDAHWGQQLD